MKKPHLPVSRRRLLGLFAALGSSLLTACSKVAETSWFSAALSAGEVINKSIHKAVGGKSSLAQEFSEADLSPSFRGNGTTNPSSADYQNHVRTSFTNWQLRVDGLVDQPTTYTMARIRELSARTQITRHDCVEGWSAIGKWKGVPLALILGEVKPTAAAKFVVFHCTDTYPGRDSAAPVPYYESVDLEDATHAQTILAYELNNSALPVKNGALLRLRVERQLGYKQAKYIQRIELVASLDKIGKGKGGFWEDRSGYQWYAGI
jgi:DMSO/TMAO reductase YedYZ molybdopterin-dependent catalytic subunit